MYNYRITYINEDGDDEHYDIESACTSIGLFLICHSWAISNIEQVQQLTIRAIERLDYVGGSEYY